jgi:hypothetical protein
LERDFEAWRSEVDGEIAELRSWANERLPVLLNCPDVRLADKRQRFIRCAVEAAVTHPDGCWTSDELGRKIRDIEVAVKGRHARLQPGAPFERWLKQPSRIASGRLDYRWPKRLLKNWTFVRGLNG